MVCETHQPHASTLQQSIRTKETFAFPVGMPAQTRGGCWNSTVVRLPFGLFGIRKGHIPLAEKTLLPQCLDTDTADTVKSFLLFFFH